MSDPVWTTIMPYTEMFGVDELHAAVFMADEDKEQKNSCIGLSLPEDSRQQVIKFLRFATLIRIRVSIVADTESQLNNACKLATGILQRYRRVPLERALAGELQVRN